MSYFYAVSDIDVLNKLHALTLLPETERAKYVAAVRSLAVSTPDAAFSTAKQCLSSPGMRLSRF